MSQIPLTSPDILANKHGQLDIQIHTAPEQASFSKLLPNNVTGHTDHVGGRNLTPSPHYPHVFFLNSENQPGPSNGIDGKFI